MVEPSGIEPLTPCVQGRCSPSWAKAPILILNGREDRIWTCDPLVPNQVHYQAVLLPVQYIFQNSIGALGRNRTHNLLIRSQALYPVELLAHLFNSASILYHIRCSFATLFCIFFKFFFWRIFSRNGAQGRSRTGTDFKVRRILSPVRLPISPPGQFNF